MRDQKGRRCSLRVASSPGLSPVLGLFPLLLRLAVVLGLALMLELGHS